MFTRCLHTVGSGSLYEQAWDHSTDDDDDEFGDGFDRGSKSKTMGERGSKSYSHSHGHGHGHGVRGSGSPTGRKSKTMSASAYGNRIDAMMRPIVRDTLRSGAVQERIVFE